jgi:hypothetical protein
MDCKANRKDRIRRMTSTEKLKIGRGQTYEGSHERGDGGREVELIGCSSQRASTESPTSSAYFTVHGVKGRHNIDRQPGNPDKACKTRDIDKYQTRYRYKMLF